MTEEQAAGDPVSTALTIVKRLQSWILTWQDFAASALADAKAEHPAWSTIAYRFTVQSSPRKILDGIRSGDARPVDAVGITALLGTHAEMLLDGLNDAQDWWTSAQTRAAAVAGAAGAPPTPSVTEFLASLEQLQAALGRAMQHSLSLTFLDNIRRGHTGDSLNVDDYCKAWGLDSAQIDTVWLSLSGDKPEFNGVKLNVVFDMAHRCAYCAAPRNWRRLWYASAVLWGAAIIYGLLVGLFVLLHVAGVWHYKASWAWKLLILVLFVLIGAWAHIGAKFVNVNYDNPISIYDASGKLDWLALRWGGVLQMYIPVGVVAASLWGAGNVPTSFQKLGTALLAGYSADSFVSAALSKAKSADKQPDKAAPVLTTTGKGATTKP